METSNKKKFPKTLFVRHEEFMYSLCLTGLTQMVGYRAIESAVNESGNDVAIYKLVSADHYKKTVTRVETETVEVKKA